MDRLMNQVSELFALTGEVALVTGASRGIGAGIADLLGQAGATVIGTATSAAGADAITARFKAAGISGRGIELDISVSASIQAAIKDISAQEGAVSPVTRLVDERHHGGAAASEEDRADRNALGILPFGCDHGTLARGRREAARRAPLLPPPWRYRDPRRWIRRHASHWSNSSVRDRRGG